MQTALKLAPADSDAQHELGGSFCQRAKNDLAEAAYRPLVAAHPNDAEFHRGLGQALAAAETVSGSAKGTSGGGAIEAGLAEVYVDLAFAASENKNYDLTIRALNGRTLLNAEMPASVISSRLRV